MIVHDRPARIYIAGPMNSVGGNFNFPLFDHVSMRLKLVGCEVHSPVDVARKEIGPLEVIQKLDKKEMAKIRKYMLKQEINWIMDNADFVVLLPGWERSSGARAEKAIAEAIDIPVRVLPNTIIFSYDHPEERVQAAIEKLVER